MKKVLNKAAILIAVVSLIFTSCNNEPGKPNIIVKQNTTGDIVQGETVEFELNVTSDLDNTVTLRQFEAQASVTGADVTGVDNTGGVFESVGNLSSFVDGKSEVTFKYSYVVPADAQTGDITIKFKVTDSEGNYTEKEMSFTVLAAAPVVTVTKTYDGPLNPGAEVTYTITTSSVKKLKSVRVEVTTGGNPAIGGAGTEITDENSVFETGTTNFIADLKEATFGYTHVINAAYDVGDEISVKFIVVTENDDEGSATETIVIEATPISEYTGKTLSYDSENLDASNQFNVEKGLSVSSAWVGASPDDEESHFAFCWQDAAGYSVVSPNSVWLAQLYQANGLTYTSNTVTKLQTTTKAYAEIDAAYLEALTVGNEGDIKGLSDGDVVLFETSTGQKGAVKITIPTTKAQKTITIDVKVQD